MKKIKELAEEWGPFVIWITVLSAVCAVSNWIAEILTNRVADFIITKIKK